MAEGAQGGRSALFLGGRGAEIGGDVMLQAGEVLTIAVGGAGHNAYDGYGSVSLATYAAEGGPPPPRTTQPVIGATEWFAPVLTGGSTDQAWRRIVDRSGYSLRLTLTNDPDLHLVVDGVRLNPVNKGSNGV